MKPVRGEVWLLDLGMAEKVRPALILSVAFGDNDRALIDPARSLEPRQATQPDRLPHADAATLL